ncbi:MULTISPECIES: hypothetical protein [Pseudothermotoga]|uniref:hypothetical protein n=1 Tax=Pseudothermotoga TaxID=1643951 RepID=UPI00041CB59E|nr:MULTISPECIES: hypothetical protein [Pseudothermotoga]GLI49413.1 hypothetical protein PLETTINGATMO_15820 [Pseudothermotoga lettingae TMO]HBT25253.1 hypothetical protein [Pseudothermotoga sp.]
MTDITSLSNIGDEHITGIISELSSKDDWSDCVVYVISVERRNQRTFFHLKKDEVSCAGL